MLRFLASVFSFFFSSSEQKFLNSLGAEIRGDKIIIPIESLQSKIYKPRAKNLSCQPLDSKNASKGEKICMDVLKKIYRKSFYRVRPDFLKNPETGKNLEIDIFNAELGIGCEYNGKQHYRYPSFPGHTREKFIKSLKRDLYKIQRCKKLGIYLIIVPYTVKDDKIEEYIRSRLPPK